MTSNFHLDHASRRTGATGALIAGAFVVLAGCATGTAGIRGHEDFERRAVPDVLIGQRALSEAAGCFETRARFLPLSEFSRGAAGADFVYRLRISDVWFEQVKIVADDAGGSRAEVRIAPNLDERWHLQFGRERGLPLADCMGIPRSIDGKPS